MPPYTCMSRFGCWAWGVNSFEGLAQGLGTLELDAECVRSWVAWVEGSCKGHYCSFRARTRQLLKLRRRFHAQKAPKTCEWSAVLPFVSEYEACSLPVDAGSLLQRMPASGARIINPERRKPQNNGSTTQWSKLRLTTAPARSLP